MKSPIIYEPHPVSAERKRQLRQQGLIIVDAIYKPQELIELEAANAAASVESLAAADRDRREAEKAAADKAAAEKAGAEEKAAEPEAPAADPSPPAKEEKQQPLSLGKRNGNR